jgi:hypothetical protein
MALLGKVLGGIPAVRTIRTDCPDVLFQCIEGVAGAK